MNDEHIHSFHESKIPTLEHSLCSVSYTVRTAFMAKKGICINAYCQFNSYSFHLQKIESNTHRDQRPEAAGEC